MNLKITVNPYEKDKLLAYANIVIDNQYALENVKIKTGQYGNYVELPKYAIIQKDDNGNILKDIRGNNIYSYKDVFHPITSQANKDFEDAILIEYNKTKELGKGNHKDGGEYGIGGEFGISRITATPYVRDNIVGLATIGFDDSFMLEKVKIKVSEKGEYLDLPKYRTLQKDESGVPVLDENGRNTFEYKDVFHPITAESAKSLKEAVTNALHNKMEQQIANSEPLDLTTEQSASMGR